MHNIKEFPKCAICNNDIKRNVVNALVGYTTRKDNADELFCCGNCAKKSMHYVNA